MTGQARLSIGARGMSGWFEETNWWVVRQARTGRAEEREAAVAWLYQTYRRPVHLYIRRHGFNHEDAEDLREEFFAHCLEKGALELADQDKGRLRCWVLLWLRRFLADHWDRAHRLKRGAGEPRVSLEATAGDALVGLAPDEAPTPDQLLDRSWAQSVLERAWEALQQEHRNPRQWPWFEVLQPLVLGESEQPYAQVAKKLGWTETRVKVTVHRLRRRFRQLVEQQLARQTCDPAEARREYQDLRDILRHRSGLRPAGP